MYQPCTAIYLFFRNPDELSVICLMALKRPAESDDCAVIQSLESPDPFCVTLNRDADIHRDRMLGHFEYDHPIYTTASVAAQKRWDEINGPLDTFFCGAYWGNGFHEDGVKSALRVCDRFGKGL